MASSNRTIERSKALTPEFYNSTILKSGTDEPSFRAIRGPLTLCRFGRVNFGEMQCWFSREEYLRAVAYANANATARAASHGDAIRRCLRDRLAIRLDWNDMSKLSFLHLPEDVTVEAFESRVKAQPLINASAGTGATSSRTGTEPVPSLRGGGTQYWLLPVPAWFETRPMFLRGG